VLQAVLQAASLPVSPVEVTPAPEPVPEPVVVPVADPPAAAPPPLPATTPSVAQPAPPADPAGSVTLGILTGAHAGDLMRPGDRYPARVDREPRMLGGVLATYPAEARRVRAGGRVAVVLDLDERGQVTSVELVRDDPLFSQAVTEALQHARFAPAEVATHPVPYWIAVEFVFSIDADDPTTRAAGAFSTTGSGTTAAAPAVK
jgi:TonB family protein